MTVFKVWNGPMPTTAAQAAVFTNTVIETLLQVSTPSDMQALVLGWGFTLAGPPGADGVFELLETGAVAATVTAHVASGFVKRDPNQPGTKMTLGTANSGYTATAEGAIVATRVFDAKFVSGSSGESTLDYEKIFTPAERPLIAVSSFLRIRCTTPTTGTGVRCWVLIDEGA